MQGILCDERICCSLQSKERSYKKEARTKDEDQQTKEKEVGDVKLTCRHQSRVCTPLV